MKNVYNSRLILFFDLSCQQWFANVWVKQKNIYISSQIYAIVAWQHHLSCFS